MVGILRNPNRTRLRPSDFCKTCHRLHDRCLCHLEKMTMNTTTPEIPAETCRHNLTIPGVDHLGAYVRCTSCNQRGRPHRHTAQILSFGPGSEPVEKRCPFCAADAAGQRVILREHGSYIRVYVDGSHRGGLTQTGNDRWLIQWRDLQGIAHELGAMDKAHGVKEIAWRSGVGITLSSVPELTLE